MGSRSSEWFRLFFSFGAVTNVVLKSHATLILFLNMSTQQNELVRTARLAGIWYLVLALSGMAGFLALHPKVYVSGDVAQTLTNLTEQKILAQMRLLAEFVIVVSQALAAVYFFKLFKDINHFAAWSLAAWGTVNAVVIMISAVSMGGAIEVASGDLPTEQKLLVIQVFMQFIKHAWGVGSLFFGLWLIPMGYIVVRSQRLPLWLGRVLVLGGVGYLASAFLGYAGAEGAWVGMLTIPATVGELWIVGYLLIYGIRPQQ